MKAESRPKGGLKVAEETPRRPAADSKGGGQKISSPASEKKRHPCVDTEGKGQTDASASRGGGESANI